MLYSRFRDTEVLFVGLKPPLVRIFERRGEGGHDLAAIAQVATDLCPFFRFANGIEASTNLDGLFQFVQIERALIDAGESVEVGAVLLVEFGQLVEVIQIRAGSWIESERTNRKQDERREHTSFNRVELLSTSFEVKPLHVDMND